MDEAILLKDLEALKGQDKTRMDVLELINREKLKTVMVKDYE